MNRANQSVVDRLQQAKSKMLNNRDLMQSIVQPKDEVIDRYSELFNVKRIESLTKEEFQRFLHFKNNRHWTGLYRSQAKICKDMDQLREALKVLLNVNLEIDKRIDRVNRMVDGMGRAITSAILLITEPHNYGVWNNTSEGGLKQLGVWPDFERGDSLGKKYLRINGILKELAKTIDVDLWTLDSIWWAIRTSPTEDIEYLEAIDRIEPEAELRSSFSFGLEKYLHEFLVDNWELTELSEEWDIYSEEGNDKAGYKYPCGSWEIDILAKHKTENRWLVIELKRNQTSDATAGQILRYMGWVRKELAEPKDKVEGLIIAKQIDKKLQYAISEVPGVKFRGYKVSFSLD